MLGNDGNINSFIDDEEGNDVSMEDDECKYLFSHDFCFLIMIIAYNTDEETK